MRLCVMNFQRRTSKLSNKFWNYQIVLSFDHSICNLELRTIFTASHRFESSYKPVWQNHISANICRVSAKFVTANVQTIQSKCKPGAVHKVPFVARNSSVLNPITSVSFCDREPDSLLSCSSLMIILSCRSILWV